MSHAISYFALTLLSAPHKRGSNRRLATLGLLVGSLLIVGCDNRTDAERLAEAQASIQAGEYRPAIIELKNLIQDAPNNPEARLALGGVSMQVGDYPSAVKEYERAVRLLPDRLDVRQRLYDSQLASGDAESVASAIGEDPLDNAELLALRGEARIGIERFDDAQADFPKAREMDPENVRAHRGLAQLSWQAGDNVSALESLNRALELAPDDVDSILAAAEIHLGERDLDSARARYQAATQTLRGRDLGYLGLARTAIVSDDMTAAGTALDGLSAPGSQMPMARYARALVAYNQGDADTAETELLGVLDVAAGHFPSLAMLGAIKYEEGQLSTAADYLRRAYAVSPGDESVVKMLADVRAQQGDLDGASQVLLPLVEQTDDPQLVAMYGSIQQRRGNSAEAIAYLQRAVEMAPDQAEIRSQLGMSLFADGDLAGAEAALSSAIDLNEDLLQSEQLLLLTKLGQGDVAAAREIVDSMLAADGEDATARFLESSVLEAEGDAEGAQAAIRRSLQIDPTYTPALEAYIGLKGGLGDEAAAAYQAALAADDTHYPSLMGLAQLAFDDGDFETGEALLRRASLAHPGQTVPKVLLARYYLGESRREEADQLVKQALELAPNAPEVLLLSGQMNLADGDFGSARLRATELAGRLSPDSNAAGFLLQSGELFAASGLIDRALQTFRRVYELGGELAPAAGVQIVQLETRAGNLDAAESMLGQLEASQPNSDQLSMLRSDLAARRGNFDSAGAGLTPLVAAGDRDATVRLALLRQRQGNSSDAISLLDDLLDREPGDVGARQLRASIRLAEGDTDAGLAEYEEILKLRPNSIVALNNLAYLYSERDDERAVSLAEKAYELDPENASVADTLGMVYVRFGQANRGADIMRQAQSIAPDSWEINRNLGRALTQAGERSEARTAFDRALRG